MRRVNFFIMVPLLVLQTWGKGDDESKRPRVIKRQASEAIERGPNMSRSFMSTEISDMSFKNLTISILPNKNFIVSPHTTNMRSSTTPTTVPHHHKHYQKKKRPSGKMKSNPMFTHPTDHRHHHHHFQCIATVPRMNLQFNKILGTWYPVRFSPSTLKLWSESFPNEHKTRMRNCSCFRLEYSSENLSNNDLTAISLAVHSKDESIQVKAILIGDEKHPKGSKWAISWPNGEDTLTSVVAAGVVGKERNQYSWLLTVDCDINGIVESDWAVMARVPEGISNATLNAILAILEGLKGIRVKHAITFQSEHCHK